MTAIKEMYCHFFGHDWRYNFPSIPNKRICAHCKLRRGLDLKLLSWDISFEDERTDKELISKWVK